MPRPVLIDCASWPLTYVRIRPQRKCALPCVRALRRCRPSSAAVTPSSAPPQAALCLCIGYGLSLHTIALIRATHFLRLRTDHPLERVVRALQASEYLHAWYVCGPVSSYVHSGCGRFLFAAGHVHPC